MSTVPKTVYKTPTPEDQVSELYTIYAEEPAEATDQNKRWVVKERYGAWDEAEPNPKDRFKIKEFTLSPTDPKHCLTIDKALKQVDEQVRYRAKNGFKYLFMRDFYDTPYITL